MKKYILIRHGHTSVNEREQVEETELDDLGVRQISDLAHYLVKMQIDKIYTSPYQRALRSAEIIARELSVGLEMDDRLKEIGLWINPNDLHDDSSEEYLTALSLLIDTEKRIESLLGELNRRPEKTIAIVCHGNLIRAILGFVLKMNLETVVRLNAGHASISVIEYDDSGKESFYRLEQLNNREYLGKLS